MVTPVTFVRQADDGTREPSEPDEDDGHQGFDKPVSSPDQSPPTFPPDTVESVPSISSGDFPGQEPSDVTTPTPREAYLIRSYIQKIAAVVSFRKDLEYMTMPNSSRRIYVTRSLISAPRSHAGRSKNQCCSKLS